MIINIKEPLLRSLNSVCFTFMNIKERKQKLKQVRFSERPFSYQEVQIP